MIQISFLHAALLGLALLSAGAAEAAVVGATAVRTDANQITVTWTVVNGSSVDVLFSTDPAAPPSAMRIISIRDYDGEHVAPALKSRSYFFIQDSGGDGQKVAERIVPLAGAANFRDVGGYRTQDGRHVRWGMVYRSSELSDLTAEDYESLDLLGIRTVYDLRSVEERNAKPTVWQGAAAPQVLAHDYAIDKSAVATALSDGVSAAMAKVAMILSYPRMVDDHRTQFRAIFTELLREGSGAVLYHGAAGNHRTGVQTALILAALGVPREVILADFELSNAYSKAKAGEADSTRPSAKRPSDVTAALTTVDKAYLQAFFDAVDNHYGSVDNYLTKLGVGPTERHALRARYTE